ncbi:transcription antitermination protein NusB [Erysipelothrix rhusiopathiae]|uniref:Transcription antitermination protein NusB n=2 Tax=Erysipelotrichaceae TaxID=128827 RepID=A0A3S8RN03_9FIRM|nr:transcription antitermination protein NusB [Erysipelothrix piscisicarius]MBK2402506.1 transcription antitermination protein NusB [Erysipelothrix sp. strain 2 (EsS2-6-Brazil)]MBK2403395.1 transcription antitermination protein NusB [Erysipelothrix sp. strain 2 (EsS2-7-Brazil)]NBA00637.1 transcription antitermination protein NusB [Erysipelothrix rhusiopathiae]
MVMSRYNERQNAMSAIYIHLLREQTMQEVLEDNRFVSEVGTFIQDFNLQDEMLQVVMNVEARKDIYSRAIDHYLTKWRFDRLGFIEQAILLMACAELELGYQDKVVIVNEAVNLAKDFSDEESYKLINGVIDAL